MELPVSSGYIDNFFLTPAGDMVLIECKLWRNPEARREVVAQVLDYAESLTGWSFEDLEKAALAAAGAGGAVAPDSLYASLGSDPELDEAEFIDAVSRNLRAGRMVFIIAGDGIHEETETLTAYLQSRAEAGFTLALVELAVFETPRDEEILVQPRVVARTVYIERAIVTVDDQRVTVVTPEEPAAGRVAVSKSPLSEEEFFDRLGQKFPNAPDRVREFLSKLEPLGVVPEFRRTLILRWNAVDGTGFNLAYILPTGRTWTDMIHSQARALGILDLTQKYVDRLSALIGGGSEKVSGRQADELRHFRRKGPAD